MNKIVTIKFGSHLYGTNTPASDLDIKSIYIPEARDILLNKVKDSINNSRKKVEGERNTSDDVDEEIFSLKKYLKLVAEGQTVYLDMLFAPVEFILERSWLWGHIQNNTNKLISRKTGAFVGYCHQQANKYGIKGSRVAAAREALEFLDQFPNKKQKLNLSSDIIEKFVLNSKNQNHITIEMINYIKHLVVCGKKLPYTVSIEVAMSIIRRLMDEYGHRALMAEKNEGVDWKALSHAVRIADQAIELYSTGRIDFPRPNANQLLKIKLGEYSYSYVADLIEQLEEELIWTADHSELPKEVDQKWIDDLIVCVYGDAVRYGRTPSK